MKLRAQFDDGPTARFGQSAAQPATKEGGAPGDGEEDGLGLAPYLFRKWRRMYVRWVWGGVARGGGRVAALFLHTWRRVCVSRVPG